ncbi:MAG: hypothetical protein HYT37_03450 [Candidatus Sungbacteria bacterium]|nr:hypothetical protein [Candidatus Sungbacteria bacterium]
MAERGSFFKDNGELGALIGMAKKAVVGALQEGRAMIEEQARESSEFFTIVLRVKKHYDEVVKIEKNPEKAFLKAVDQELGYLYGRNNSHSYSKSKRTSRKRES